MPTGLEVGVSWVMNEGGAAIARISEVAFIVSLSLCKSLIVCICMCCISHVQQQGAGTVDDHDVISSQHLAAFTASRSENVGSKNLPGFVATI